MGGTLDDMKGRIKEAGELTDDELLKREGRSIRWREGSRIVELRHDKHHATYVEGANKTLEQLDEVRRVSESRN